MAGLVELDQVGKREQLDDTITNIISEKVPFYAMIKKESAPNQHLIQYQMETYPDVAPTGVMDGEDVAEFDHVSRKLGYSIQQIFRRTWKVSTMAQHANVAGLGRKERGKQRAIAAILTKFAVEARYLGDGDLQLDDGVDKPFLTRGAFSWLASAAQALHPVDASFRLPSDAIHTSNLAALTEDAFAALLEGRFDERRDTGDYVGVVGVKLKGHFDKWTAYANAGASFATFPVRQWSQESGKLMRSVDFLEFSAGKVQLMQSAYLLRDQATGAQTAYTSRSGLFLDTGVWDSRGYERLHHKDLPDLGGGPRGYAQCIEALTCKHPKGQFAVKVKS